MRALSLCVPHLQRSHCGRPFFGYELDRAQMLPQLDVDATVCLENLEDSLGAASCSTQAMSAPSIRATTLCLFVPRFHALTMASFVVEMSLPWIVPLRSEEDLVVVDASCYRDSDERAPLDCDYEPSDRRHEQVSQHGHRSQACEDVERPVLPSLSLVSLVLCSLRPTRCKWCVPLMILMCAFLFPLKNSVVGYRRGRRGGVPRPCSSYGVPSTSVISCDRHGCGGEKGPGGRRSRYAGYRMMVSFRGRNTRWPSWPAGSGRRDGIPNC